jgi:hypothetical protein
MEGSGFRVEHLGVTVEGSGLRMEMLECLVVPGGDACVSSCNGRAELLHQQARCVVD